jgi:hypothetical protein
MSKLIAADIGRLLAYDAETGIFKWKIDSPRRKSGEIAGSMNKDGYMKVTVMYRTYLLHRLAWLLVHGALPDLEIDHKNGLKTDNRISNLRPVTGSVNKQNLRNAPASNKSCGLLGVTKVKGKWQAQIKLQSKNKYLGLFSTPEEAHAAYLSAKRSLHEGCTI